MPTYDQVHKKPPASEIGLKADRGCTDCFFAILFVACWCGMAYLASLAYSHGDLNRLIYGVDYMGNVCSKGDASNVTLPAQDPTAWKSRTLLYYPVSFDAKKMQFIVKDAMDLGVCVDKCPSRGDTVYTYGGTDPAPPSSYKSFFDHMVQFHRCVPKFFTFKCSSEVPGNTSECEKNLNESSSKFNSVSDFANFGKRAFDDLYKGWWIVLACSGITIVICFIWIFTLRRLVKPVVVATLVIAIFCLAILGYLLFLKSQTLKGQTPKNSAEDYYFYGAIAVWVFLFLFLCLIIFICKDIMVACDIIEEAAKIPIKIPTMVLVPPVIMLLLIPFVIFGLFTAAAIYTAAKPLTATMPVPAGMTNTTSGYVAVKTYTFENWRIYAHLGNLFMFLWTMGFLHAIGFMIIAFCAVFWYWSVPGDDKEPQGGVCDGLKLTLKHHLGTLALGSLIIAIVQIWRVILELMEHRLKAISENNQAIKCAFHCARCCLAYFERFLKFINKNAYIICTMTGENFCGSARHAISLLISNALSVGAVTVIGEYVMIFGKLLITAIACLSCWGMSKNLESGDGKDSNGVLLIIVTGVVSYFIACIFFGVLHVCIDVVLLSYCYDLEQHNGADKPYFFPSDLAKHVEKATDREAIRKKHRKGEEVLHEPLNK